MAKESGGATFEGAIVGRDVDFIVGEAEGFKLGFNDGRLVGGKVDFTEGLKEVGIDVVGFKDGFAVGAIVGFFDGVIVDGFGEGIFDEGKADGKGVVGLIVGGCGVCFPLTLTKRRKILVKQNATNIIKYLFAVLLFQKIWKGWTRHNSAIYAKS